MADEEDDDAITQSERKRALTDKGWEEKLSSKINARRGKLRQLTAKSNEIELLMENACNLDEVKNNHLKFYERLLGEFVESNTSVLLYLKEEEHAADQDFWFLPKLSCCNKFKKNVTLSIEETESGTAMSQSCDNEISPMDSVSMVASKSLISNKSGRESRSSASKKSSTSTVLSARLKEEANRSALLAKAAAAKERQALQMKEMQLKAEMEQLEIKTALAMSDAKIKVYQTCEEQQSYASHNEVTKLTAEYVPKLEGYKYDEERTSSRPEVVHSMVPVSVRPKRINAVNERPSEAKEFFSHDTDVVDLQRVMLRQTDITEMLVRNQGLACLPARDVPLFHGDPLEFRSFTRAFENAIASRTESNADKLYFLEQYTRGEPRELVKSCQHMPDNRGYSKAMKLLQERFGNELKIATALMQKAFRWPEIKSEDGKALSAYSLFLVTCQNVMEDIDYMDELDNPTNLRIIVSKLPYKLRERWRAHAYEFEEKYQKRAKFIQLVGLLTGKQR